MWLNEIVLGIDKLWYYFKYLDYFETVKGLFKVLKIIKFLCLKHPVCNSSCNHDMLTNQSTSMKTNIASKYGRNSSA